MGDVTNEQRERATVGDERGRADGPLVGASPIQPTIRWRESAHEYDFGPAEADPDLPQRRPWRGSAHEYDFGGEW